MNTGKILFTLVVVMLFSLIAISNIFCNSAKKEEATFLYENHAPDVKYVGMQTCRTCHSDKFETFIHTGMGMSFGAAHAGKSSGVFNDHAVIYDKYLDFYYRPFILRDSMYIMEYRLEGKDTVHKRIEKVDYVIGSGQHTNSHLFQVNGYFYQMPMTYYTQVRKWDFPPGFEDGFNSRFNRAIELECMSCHNAYPDFVQGSKNKFSSVLQGIDCERCHGPGELHVKTKSAGNLVDTSTQIDYTIVNPKKLPYELQVDICQRCHLQGNAILKEGKTFFDFKPGEKLSDYMNVFLPRYENETKFIMASHADRLKQSKCFIESNRQKINTNEKKYTNSKFTEQTSSSLTCVTCHNPHVSVKVTGDMIFNEACKSCHGSPQHKELTLCTETQQKRLVNGDNCWKCHMPSSGTLDIPHVSVHDHKIQIPVKKEDKDQIRKFLGIQAVNNPNPDAHIIGEAYLSYFEKFDRNISFLDSAKFYLDKKGSYSPVHYFNNLIRLYYLKLDDKMVTETAKKQAVLFSKDAWTLYRIGQSYSNINDLDNALTYYKVSVERAPYILEFRNKLAGTLLSKGDTEGAISSFEFIIQENPKFTPALSNLAFLYMQKNRTQEARVLLDRAIAIDPDYEQALLNRAALSMQLNNKKEAVIFIKRILKKDPKNEKAVMALKSLNEI